MKLPPYRSYKPSGVDWLGDVPEHWSVKAIKWETPVLRGASPRPIDNPIYFDDDEGEYSWVRISDVTSAGTYLTTTEQKLSSLGSSLSVKLKPGALFLSIAGSVGKPCITRIKCCIHDGFVYFPRFKGDAKFLYYLFASGEPYRGLGKLGTQLNLNTDTVGSIVAGFPDLDEQQAIAARLDRETGRVDRLVAKKRELIERLKEKRTALISRTVTRGLPAEAAAKAGLPTHPPPKPSGLDWLGDIPAHWEMKRLSYLFRFSSGGTPPTENAEYWEGDLPWVSPKDMKCFHLSDTIDHVSELALKETSTTAVLPETMLLVARSGILKHSIPVAITTRRMTINQDIKGVTPLRKDASVYYYAWFIEGHQSALLTEWRKEGATVESLELERVKNCALPFPPVPEQAAIAAYLDEETAKLDALVGKVEEAVERLQEYRTALITAAVTGKIDVSNL